ncbi:MAG: hypothetical protein H6Q48_1949 [Deltaproteobacteria bacterium]|nr:hypothetical protein [Deltaproteobacteria bacterium]
MEWTAKDLLDEYSRADFSKRLNLYLQYPEARSEFMEIDRKGLRVESLRVRHQSTDSPMIRVGALFSLAAWRMKRLFGIA